MEIFELHNINSLNYLKEIKSNFIDCVITSPPYDNIRSYNHSSIWNFNIFKNIADELHRVLKGNGTIVWIVSDATIDGSETGTSFRQALYFMELGFKLHDTMIYEKNGCAFPARRDGNRYSQIFEYMFVLSKDTKPKTANLICDKPNKWAGHIPWGQATMRDKEGNRVERTQKPTPKFSPRNNIWRYSTGKGFTTKDNYAFEHPSKFPESLARDHILSWSNEDDLVLDPFAGAGTTGAISIETDRQFIGFEIDNKYYTICQQRIESRQARLPI